MAGLFLLTGSKVRAGETDNFSLPLTVELADLGPYLEAVHTIALEQTIAEVNARIEKALLIKSNKTREAQLEQLHDPLLLSKVFIKRFGHPIYEGGQLESAVGGSWGKKMFPGQKPSQPGIRLNLSAHPFYDLRRWMMLSQSHTIKAFGVYFGTDKIVHFHHLGADYYWQYTALRRQGFSHEEAHARMLQHFARGGLWSEAKAFGTLTTGIYSNADLASNLMGFKFFQNFTSRVVLKGETHEPLLVCDGTFWRLNQQVRPKSGWFVAFVSDHWNEALNPNQYDALMHSGIRRYLRHRAAQIVAFYTGKDGRPADPEYFNNLARELSTYYGEDYGHSGNVEKLMTIGNTCFPELPNPEPRSIQVHPVAGVNSPERSW
jgi:hypothetical protein